MTEKPDHEQLAKEKDAEMSVETFRRWVRQMDPTLSPDDVASEAAVVMLAALQLGNKDPRRLSEFTGVPLARVNQFAERLKASGIWLADGKTACNWFDDKKDVLNADFWLDVAVAIGSLKRGEVGFARDDIVAGISAAFPSHE